MQDDGWDADIGAPKHTKNAKEFWDALEVEYEIDDTDVDRFNAPSFNKYVIGDGKFIND